jgi:hypothetical protein
MTRAYFFVLGFVLLAALAAACPDTFAGGGKKEAEKKEVDKKEADKIKVTFVVILAKEEGGEIDPRLVQIAEEVQKRDPQLKSFKVQSITVRKLAEDEKSAFNLVEQKSADIVIKQRADEDNKVVISITPPDQGEIVLGAACGKYLPYVMRHQTKNRERLILALRVDPCAGK